MLKNYFKTAWRNLWKNKGFSAINITGLAIGLATCLLIMLYVMHELSYDKYNKKSARIYRLNNELKFGGNYFDVAQTPPLLGPTMVQQFPQVEQYTRFRWHSPLLVKKGNEILRETNITYADSTLLDVFTLPMISGNPKTVLTEPFSLVITESIAKKYFNRTDVAGQQLVVNDNINYKISGVIKDIPAESHFHYDFFVAMSEYANSREENEWLSQNYNTYVVLKEDADVNKLAAPVNQLLENRIGPILKNFINTDIEQFKKDGGFTRITYTPLTDIHLRSNRLGDIGANGNITYVYIFSAIALFILLIACVNFMNLSTARSSNRAKEVGIRKVLGSVRTNLITQFLAESLLMSFLSLVLALVIAWGMLPYFNQLAGITIQPGSLFQPGMMAALVALVIVVGLLAGSYPAFFLSSFQPIQVLKGRLAKGFKGSWLRNGLVVFQFAVSIVLITGTLVIYSQLKYLRSRDIGYTREQVLIIKNTGVLNNQLSSFKNELSKLNDIKNVTLSGYLPNTGDRNSNGFFPTPAMNQKEALIMQNWIVDENYIPTLDIQLLQGRNFSQQMPTDSMAIIVNEAAARYLPKEDLLNRKLYQVDDPGKPPNVYTIIGVIKNFNFNSIRDQISPLAFTLGRSPGSISMRINSANIPALLEQVKQKWQAMAPGQPFAWSFMDEEFNNQFKADQQTGQLFIAFAILAIFIACLGLFGLVTYAAEQRIKEIGVRKILGASVSNIVTMLSKDLLKLVLLANIIAWPVAWWIMNSWLQDFAYRIQIGWWVFAVAGIIAVLIALVTVSFKAIKAALANPVRSLRSE